MLVKTVLNWFHPTIDAFLATEVPFHYRWRLLLFQPVAILAYLINTVPTLFSKRATELEIPVRNGRKIRSLLYLPPQCCRALGPDYEDLRSTQQAIAQPLLRPLHLDIHGGGFLGGRPEANHRFCSALSARTGAVVVSTTYRFAPRYPFPAAIDDIDDVVAWLLEHAASKLQADPECFTLSGSSAGGNLALATSLSDMPRENRCKAVVTFYAPVDVSIPPIQKPRPAKYPTRDPLSFLLPLFDAYGASTRPKHVNDPRASPCKARVDQLPNKILMVVPTIDILLAEQLQFADRVNHESRSRGEKEKIELMVMENCFHGWLELPAAVVDESTRSEVFDRSIKFLQDVYHEHGSHAR